MNSLFTSLNAYMITYHVRQYTSGSSVIALKLSFDKTPLYKLRPNAETPVQLTARNVYFTKSLNMGVLSHRKSTYEYIAHRLLYEIRKVELQGGKKDSTFPA